VSPTQVVQQATSVLQVVRTPAGGPAIRAARVEVSASPIASSTSRDGRGPSRHWRDRTPQSEFVVVFKQLLARAYLGKLENYSGEQIVYLGETVDGDFATVRSKIVTGRGAEIPVDYRLHLVGSRWAVYDVAVQGVSFVANYRGQFAKIIRS
jgi:phospholipid transport system substrate-binding protein